MTFYDLLTTTIDDIKEQIQWMWMDDDYFDVGSMDIYDIIIDCVGNNTPIYNSDIVEVFSSESDLWYYDNEFGDTDDILNNISGRIMSKLSDDVHEWWNDEGMDEMEKEFNDYQKEKETE